MGLKAQDTAELFFENVRVREVPGGEGRRVHITNLVNRGTILINYDQGDEGRPGLAGPPR